MPIETFPIGPLETNCHIVISGSDAVAVDPGGDLNSGLGEVLALLTEQNLTLRALLSTAPPGMPPCSAPSSAAAAHGASLR